MTKKLINPKSLLLMLLMALCISCYAQKADDIIGYYYSVDPFSKEGSQNYIYKAADGTYEGMVTWVSKFSFSTSSATSASTLPHCEGGIESSVETGRAPSLQTNR